MNWKGEGVRRWNGREEEEDLFVVRERVMNNEGKVRLVLYIANR